MQGDFSLGDLAVRFGLELRGEPSLRVSRVATLSHAQPGTLSFLANPKYRRQLESTRATAVLVAAQNAASCRVAALVDPNPYLAYARIAAVLHPEAPAAPGIHPSAVVSPKARVAPSASVAALAVIEDDAQVDDWVLVGPGSIVQHGARIGADSRLIARVTVCAGVRIGQRCILHPGAVVGADGFGFAPDAGTWLKVPQIGSVQIGDDVEIGANTTIDRGAIDDTLVEQGVKLDNQIQVGHNVTIGAHTAVAGCVGISGSTTIGRRCMIGGGVGIAGHLTIADDVVVTGCSLVSASIREAGSYSSGMPAVQTRLWRRMVAHLRRLDVKER
ncbi:MAG TPA: UDP-3-O-(3-hydroxymyristoyl)glucosamine N-acyltransferase [Steroidobacteraceae bacterium]|nr:UDP-3-O-(3-hydroxymyristoyl)glucosamine N-acyltransferase [Steroidobacteraceae bacterium]